ncbi:MAG: CsgG/HfaB family protein [Myxococcales bacterium]
MAVVAISACHNGAARGNAPHPRIREAEAAARQAIAVEAQLRPDTLSVRTVGVLPFDQTGLDSSVASLGYGLADLLRVDLSKSRQLRIVDRIRLDAIVRELALAASGRADSSTAPRVGRLVQARRVVYGALDARGSTMGVNVGVADASTRQIQPAASAEMRLDDILDTEKQIAFKVFENMGIALTAAERAAVEERPTKNIAAFIAYGRAVRYETEFRFADAVTEYREAVRLDPTFALAATRLEEVAALAGMASRRNALARATGFTVDRVNGVFTSPIGGGQPAGGATDPAFPALIITIFITIVTPR